MPYHSRLEGAGFTPNSLNNGDPVEKRQGSSMQIGLLHLCLQY